MSTPATALSLLPSADPPPVYAGNGQLVLACLLGIAVVVVLITVVKVHPFLALILGSAVLGAVATMPPSVIITSFVKGFGDTAGGVGILIALGAMIGKLLEDSGGANRIVQTIIGRVGPGRLPWAMALIAAIIGLPLFFEVGLSVLHGLVPPHPGPLTAIALLKADLGITLLFGLIVAVPTLIVAGPVLAHLVDQWVPTTAPAALGGVPADLGARTSSAGARQGERPNARGRAGRSATATAAREAKARTPRPGRQVPFGAALISITLPVLLMLADAIAKLTVRDEKSGVRVVLDLIGNPVVALLLATILAFFALGLRSGMRRDAISASLGGGLPGIAAILLIVAAGGGFKQTLVDAGIGNVIKDWATGMNLSVLLGIRLGTGSATVATITAAGIVGPLATTLSASHLALLVLAIGCGSLFFSHVNDAGFWLVKEYFGLTVGETIKSWSVMETVISVVGFLLVLLLSLVV